MSIAITPVKIEDLRRIIESSANQITFLNTALMAMHEHNYELGSDELMGLQTIMFDIESKLRGADSCLCKFNHILDSQLTENIQTPRQAAEAYLAQEQ